MSAASPSASKVRFGEFEVDLVAGELRKTGARVRLQEQPFQILRALLARPGDVVTRDELRLRIWGADTYVDFDRSLNTAVARLREALGDSPTKSRFIETVPRKGYRFVGRLGEQEPPSVSEPPMNRRRRVPLLFGLAGIVALAAVALMSRSGPAPDEPTAPLEVEPLTSYVGIENGATLSPDGNQVAFTWNGEDQDNFDIYVRTIAGSDLVRLTDNPAPDLSPAWSPNGQWIAFAREAGPNRYRIFRKPPLGGAEIPVLDIHAAPFYTNHKSAAHRFLAWTPDSKNLIVSLREGSDEFESLHLYSLDDGELLRLTSPAPPFADHAPAVFADGRRLAFQRWKNNVSPTFVMPLSEDFQAAGRPKQVTDSKVYLTPTWFPDGERLILSGASVATGLRSIAADGSGPPVRLPVLGAQAGMAPTVAAGRLVFAAPNFDVNVWRIDLTSLRSGPQSIIASTAPLDGLAQYSPDGRHIVFFTNRTSRSGLWVAKADGSDPQLRGRGIAFSRWSPDGGRFAFDATPPGPDRSGDIWTIGAGGGPRSQLTSHPGNDRVPNWSRDGEWIYFSSDRSGRQEVWKMPVEGGEDDARQITRQGGFFAQEAYDGRTLYYGTENPKALWRVPVDGGWEEEVAPAISNWASFAVAPHGVYFAAPLPEPPGDAIYFLDFEGGAISEIYRPEKTLSIGLDVSPDGRYLLFAQMDREDSDLMLVEGFK